MKNELSHEEIDDLIKKSLTEEEAEYYNQLDEQGLLGQLTDLYRGKLKWLNVLMAVISLVLVGIAIYCLIQFLNVTDTQEMLRWGAGMFASLIMQALLKIWSWNQMDKNVIIREMKRLEYQISLLKVKS